MANLSNKCLEFKKGSVRIINYADTANIIAGGSCSCYCGGLGDWRYYGEARNSNDCQMGLCLLTTPCGISPYYRCIYPNGYYDQFVPSECTLL